jgi:hypothetical protein
MQHIVVRALAIALIVVPGPGEAQGFRTSTLIGYSAPVPGALRGEMMSPAAIGSALQGGPFIGFGLERPAPVGLRLDAVYSRRSSEPRQQAASGSAYAAEREVTVGAVANLLLPIARPSGTAMVRMSLGPGVMRAELRGHGIIGGDGVTPVSQSRVAPALGAGIEFLGRLRGVDALLALRGGQMLSRERGGGYIAAGVGVLW